MAIGPVNRPKGRSVKSLGMVWAFATRYPRHIVIAATALGLAAAATTSIPLGFKLVIDKGFGSGAGNAQSIAPCVCASAVRLIDVTLIVRVASTLPWT